MYTQCPECLSVFSVDARTLAQAHGFVMCGHCGAGFDCISSLADQLPPEPFAELPKHERGVEPPRVDLVVYRPHRSAPTPAPAAAKLEDFSNLIIAPRFAREQYIEKPRRWPWILACFLLLFGLAAAIGLGFARHHYQRCHRRPMVAPGLRNIAVRIATRARCRQTAFTRTRCTGASVRGECFDDQRHGA